MADQTQPWAERTVEVPPQRDEFRRGVAAVGQRRTPRTEQFTTVGSADWSDGAAPRRSMSWHLARLRRGRGWSTTGGFFAFVCWAIWAISGRGNLTIPVLIFGLTLLTAAGVFTVARLLGRLVWERQLGRVRRTARGSHLVTALFLAAVGVAYLQQTAWVVAAWNWITSH
ncbi:hypothetical protein ACNAW0_17745 [Micromonospora sp. SL1-18]|uniref:hypothetical protein n=1 Tax=Micromonospora sp. SL1-18 TaxID=3399128 RepID=UPI003A4E018C